MIIIDLTQVMIANIMALYGKHIADTPIELDLFRSTTLNTIRSFNVKFSKKYGDMIIATDGKRSWRRDVFPQYKANRKKSRSQSDIDWSLIFNNLNTIRDEIKEYFPYKVINVDEAEADDVIATLVINASQNTPREDILILSGDKDFIQLQAFDNVKQYDPVKKSFIKSDDPQLFLKEHIIKGDVGDGIPNFLSPDNSFVDSIRQKSVTQKNLAAWLTMPPEDFCTEETVNYYLRNKTLIDLTMIPDRVRDKVLIEFQNQEGKDRSKIFNYMVKNKLKVLLESINDF